MQDVQHIAGRPSNMSGQASGRCDFRLLSGAGAEPWRDYLRDMLVDNDLHLTVECQTLNPELDDVRECSNCVTVVILLSPSVLETMTNNVARIETILHNHSCVAVIRAGTSSEDFDRDIKSNYPSSTSWPMFEISMETEDDNRQMIAKIIDIFEKEITRPISQPRKPRKPRTSLRQTSGGGKHVETPSAVKSIVSMVIPDCIRKADERVLVVFREEVAGTVQINFRDDTTKHDTKKINPYNYMFKAPAHKAGRTKINIYIDGEKVGHSWPFRYETPVHLAYQSPAFLCQLLGLDETDPQSLDNHLAALYKDSVPNDGALSHILTPRAMLDAPSSVTCEHRFPTLLHFAAHYGLQDLCATILETPGAYRAFEVTNDSLQNPYDLAKEQGHDDIAEYMDSFMELQCYVEDVYEHMEKFYINNAPNAGEGVRGYLCMGGQDRVPYVDYSAGGFPAPAESGYVLGNVQDNLVSEVRADEDVCAPPDIPVRKPRTDSISRTSKADRPPPPSSLPPVNDPAPDHMVSPLRSSKTDRPLPPASLPTAKDPASVHTTSTLYTPAETPEDIFAMPSPISTYAMGSHSSDELYQMQEGFKQGDFNMDEVERLFHSWSDRNRDPSASMKDRQTKLREIKEKHATLMRTAEARCKKKPGFFSRFTKKKSKEPIYQPKIEHCVGNQYSTVPPHGPDKWSSTANRGSDRVSTISNTSTVSSSSSGSHDSALSPLDEYSDSEPDETAPPPPVPRRGSSRRESQENRRSLSLQFLESTRQNPASRLPKPPPVPPSLPSNRETVAAPKLPLRKQSLS